MTRSCVSLSFLELNRNRQYYRATDYRYSPLFRGGGGCHLSISSSRSSNAYLLQSTWERSVSLGLVSNFLSNDCVVILGLAVRDNTKVTQTDRPKFQLIDETMRR